jgi:hypothetical protein
MLWFGRNQYRNVAIVRSIYLHSEAQETPNVMVLAALHAHL